MEIRKFSPFASQINKTNNCKQYKPIEFNRKKLSWKLLYFYVSFYLPNWQKF